MDLQSNLIESNKQKQKGGWRASTASIGVHSLLLAFVVYMGAQATQKVNAERQIKAFVVEGAAPPPPHRRLLPHPRQARLRRRHPRSNRRSSRSRS